MAYNELVQRGTADFPFDFFSLNKNHPKYQMSAHWHSEAEFIRVLKGSFKVRLNNREYIATKGDVIFVNPETVHQGTPTDCEYECIIFHIDSLCTSLSGCNSFIQSVFNHDYFIKEYNPYEDSDFHKASYEIFEALKQRSLGYKFRVIAGVYNFLSVVTDKSLYTLSGSGAGISDDKSIVKLKKILSFIRENYDKPITLSDMAQTANMSHKYFGTFFKKMTDKTPIEYLNEYRIERAQRKLLNSDLSITDISFSCGFNDLSYFIKTFKRISSVTPNEFRKKAYSE